MELSLKLYRYVLPQFNSTTFGYKGKKEMSDL